MGRSSVFEWIDIFLDGVYWNLVSSGSLSKEFWVMDSLSSWSNFLSSHEEIVTISVVRVIRVQHGVEWTSISWVAVQHIKVSVILFSNKFSENLLINSIQIFKWSLNVAVFSKKSYCFLKVKSYNWGLAFKWLEMILFSYNVEFSSESAFKSIENENEEIS